MTLTEYLRKRRFQKSPEPTGKTAKRPSARRLQYVVQKHAARRLHYDFRLELEGVLVSWAVPKGPSLDPGEKRLAVHVEDHPLEYASFEGHIPQGEYGAGEVIVWDRGTWEPLGDPRQALRKGTLEFELQGEKLSGGWRLVRLPPRDGEKRDNWLLMKRRDSAARSESELDVTAELPASVKSGKELGVPLRESHPRRTSIADYFPLALATLVPEPPNDDGWVHEIKFDGYRLLATIEAGARTQPAVRLFTRNQLDWTSRYPAIAQALADLPIKSAVIDGELVALDDQGVSRFQLLQNSGHAPVVHTYFAFDLLQLNGRDLRERSLVQRKQQLQRLLAGQAAHSIRYSDHLASQGGIFLQECCRRGLEGIVSKRAKGTYHRGRSQSWLKVKCLGREELVIGGYSASTVASRELGALLLGYFHEDQFVYAGRVGTGFDADTLRDLHRQLKPLHQKKSPFHKLLARERGRGVRHVQPKLVAQVEFGSWTDSGILRHASFQGLRHDKPAKSVGRPESLGGPVKEQEMQKARCVSTSGSAIKLTNATRVLYPDIGLTKQELAGYYAALAPAILPHVAGRPLSLLRCPDGMDDKCFFQKHAAVGTPAILRRFPIQEKDGTSDYLVVEDAAGLESLAQISVLELHPWGAKISMVDLPDRLIFDLDPGPGISWKQVVEAAILVRDALASLKLKTFVKTSGGKGLHVVAPLRGRITWPTLKQFARTVAELLAQESPRQFTAKMAKAARPGRIFLDYLRNDRGATAVAPYSPRARAGAPVSMPLSWQELPGVESSSQFTIRSLLESPQRLRRNPWRGFHAIKQALPNLNAIRSAQ